MVKHQKRPQCLQCEYCKRITAGGRWAPSHHSTHAQYGCFIHRPILNVIVACKVGEKNFLNLSFQSKEKNLSSRCLCHIYHQSFSQLVPIFCFLMNIHIFFASLIHKFTIPCWQSNNCLHVHARNLCYLCWLHRDTRGHMCAMKLTARMQLPQYIGFTPNGHKIHLRGLQCVFSLGAYITDRFTK